MGLFSASGASALDPQLDSGGFREEDRAVAEELAAFSAEERHAALIAAGHPEDLLEVQQIQSGSADDFAALLEGFPRKDQEQIWDLVRYPGLVADLARGGAKSDAELDRIAQRYPEEIRSTIRSAGRERYATWVEVYALDLEAEQALSGVIAKHPAEVRSAFQRLRGRPDLMSLLVDNVGLATRIGAAYRADPTRVEARFDTLHQEVAARKSDEEKNWARELQDPAAQEELRTAARQFAEDQGYDLEDESDGSAIQTRVVHVDHYVNANPYPYWFGYPSWYDYPYWYPASVWTHVGFRFGGGSSFIQVGLPSPYFLGWYGNYYYGARYDSWNHPGSYYGGGNRYPRHFSSARYYDDNHPRYFQGHRRHSDRFGSHGSRGSGRSGHSYDGDRRAAQERLMKRPPNDGQRSGRGFDRSERFGRRDSDGQVGGDRRRDSNERRFRENPRPPGDAVGGAPGTPPDGSSRRSRPRGRDGIDRSPNDSRRDAPDFERGGRGSSADPRERLQRRGGPRQDRQGTSGQGEPPRLERRQRSSQGRDGGEAPDLREGRDRGRRQLPDVSSPPPGRFDRADRRSGRMDRSLRDISAGSPQRSLQHSSEQSSQRSGQQRLRQRDRSQEDVRHDSVARPGGRDRGAQRFDRGAPPSVDRADHGDHRRSVGSVRPGGNNNGGGHRSGGQGGGGGRGRGGRGGDQAGREFGGGGR